MPKYYRRKSRKIKNGYGYSGYGRSRRYHRKHSRKTFLPRNKSSKTARLSTRINHKTGTFPFPDVTYAKLRYHDTVTFTATGTTSSFYIYRANSVYSPDYSQPSVGTHYQPYGYGIYATYYNYCLVLASAIRVRACNTGSQNGTTANMRIVVLPSDVVSSDETVFSNPPQRFPQVPRARYKDGNFYASNPIYIKHYQKTGTVWGLTQKHIQYDPDFAGLTAGPIPLKMCYWHIYCHCTDFTNGGGSCVCEVDITYYTKFYHRLNPTTFPFYTQGTSSTSSAPSISSI